MKRELKPKLPGGLFLEAIAANDVTGQSRVKQPRASAEESRATRQNPGGWGGTSIVP